MIYLAVRGVLARRAQSLLVLVGLVVTLVGFAGLSSGAQSTTAALNGDVGRAWDTPFDLLVRPAGSIETLERTDGLVRPNYISGIHGGITMSQLLAIRHIPGISLAAPLATIGAVNWPSAFQVRLPRAIKQTSAFRVRSSIVGQAGLSHYRIETRYVVVAPKGELNFDTGLLTVPGKATPILCSYPVNCFAGSVCFNGECAAGQYPSAADANYYLPLLQPIQVAGIDPVAEAELTGLNRCVTSGRLLTNQDRPSTTEDPEPAEMLPVMASDSSFLDQVLNVDIAAAPLQNHADAGRIRHWTRTEHRQVSLKSLYRSYLATSVADYLDPWPIWTAGDVRYTKISSDHLRAQQVPQDLDIYNRVNRFQEVGIDDSVLIPPEAHDPWLRPVTEHSDTHAPGVGSSYRSKIWNVLGHYDPSCLPGFDPLAGASLEAYAAPDVQTPDGKRISPSRSLSDYVASPPLLLTSLSGARWLADPARYQGQPGEAFISVIRVRVAQTQEPGSPSESRLAAAAAAIHNRTGLQVDIVKGASTRPISVDLPEGNFGRPPLTVREQWSVKGVALTFFRAVRTQDRTLLGLLFVAAGLLVGQGSYIAVRQRRFELARLRALGWSPLRLAGLIEVETTTIGLAAGAVALLIALPLAAHLGAPTTTAAVAPLLGATIAALAALPAAWTASRGSAISAMTNPRPVKLRRPPSTTIGLAVREVRRSWPIETTIGILAVALGASLVGLIVLVSAAFRAQLDTTVLGTALDTQVRPFHVVLAVLTLALGAGAAAQTSLSAWLSRRNQLGMLKALGWSGSRLAFLVCWQSLIIGAGGAAVSLPIVIASAALLGAPAGSVVVAGGTSMVGCLLATIVAAIVPCVMAVSVPARRLLMT